MERADLVVAMRGLFVSVREAVEVARTLARVAADDAENAAAAATAAVMV